MNNDTIRLEDMFPAVTIKYVNSKVRKMTVIYGFTPHEAEDFRQSLFLRLIKSRDKFDPKRGAKLETFLHCCVDNFAKDYITKLRRPQKIVRTVLVLDAPVRRNSIDGDEEVPMIETIPDETLSGQELSDIRHDVQSVLARLDELPRRMCELLMAGVEKRELPKRLGISKTRFYGVVFPRLQSEFKGLIES